MRRIRTFTASSLGLAAVTIALCVVAPLRQTSGDAAAGRIGAAVLRCAGSFDVSHAESMAAFTDHGKILYWMQRDEIGEYTSIFGPAPAVVGAIALPDFGDGGELSDDAVRARERAVAAALAALSAVLLALALRARASIARSIAGGALAAASFAGAATLGQDVWQATVALPFLCGALATLAWRSPARDDNDVAARPRAALFTPALLVVAVMIRPTIGPLAVAIGVAWALPIRSLRTWLAAAGIAVAAAVPFAIWNVIHLWSVFPIGQWTGNARIASSVFSFSQLAHGLGGLVASPARGLVWFAPLAILGVVRGFRGDRTARVLAGGIVVQLVAMAMFFKWHGGVAFGPRLLAEATWLAIFLALAHPRSRWLERTLAVATALVGLFGLALYDPDRWDTRRKPELDASAWWDATDSPLSSLFVAHEITATTDSPPVAGYRCENGRVRSIRER